MKKTWLAILGSAALWTMSPASAALITNLHLDFASGAAFDGALTFTDNYDGLLDVQGTLSGGSYGTSNINWTWWVGRGESGTAIDVDGIAATYEDWLMDGTSGGTDYRNFIGLSWYFPVAGTLALNLGADVYHAGINDSDRIVSYRTAAVPEPATLALFGAGLLGLAVLRTRRIRR